MMFALFYFVVVLEMVYFSYESRTYVWMHGWWWDRAGFREEFKRDNPDVKGVAAVGKAGGERWKSMSDAVRSLSLNEYLWLLFNCYYGLEAGFMCVLTWAAVRACQVEGVW